MGSYYITAPSSSNRQDFHNANFERAMSGSNSTQLTYQPLFPSAQSQNKYAEEIADSSNTTCSIPASHSMTSIGYDLNHFHAPFKAREPQRVNHNNITSSVCDQRLPDHLYSLDAPYMTLSEHRQPVGQTPLPLAQGVEHPPHILHHSQGIATSQPSDIGMQPENVTSDVHLQMDTSRVTDKTTTIGLDISTYLSDAHEFAHSHTGVLLSPASNYNEDALAHSPSTENEPSTISNSYGNPLPLQPPPHSYECQSAIRENLLSSQVDQAYRTPLPDGSHSAMKGAITYTHFNLPTPFAPHGVLTNTPYSSSTVTVTGGLPSPITPMLVNGYDSSEDQYDSMVASSGGHHHTQGEPRPEAEEHDGAPKGWNEYEHLSSRTRDKIDIACHFCRRRRIKCDGARPICGNCKKKVGACNYDKVARRRGAGKRTKAVLNEATSESRTTARQATTSPTSRRPPATASADKGPASTRPQLLADVVEDTPQPLHRIRLARRTHKVALDAFQLMQNTTPQPQLAEVPEQVPAIIHTVKPSYQTLPFVNPGANRAALLTQNVANPDPTSHAQAPIATHKAHLFPLAQEYPVHSTARIDAQHIARPPNPPPSHERPTKTMPASRSNSLQGGSLHSAVPSTGASYSGIPSSVDHSVYNSVASYYSPVTNTGHLLGVYPGPQFESPPINQPAAGRGQPSPAAQSTTVLEPARSPWGASSDPANNMHQRTTANVSPHYGGLSSQYPQQNFGSPLVSDATQRYDVSAIRQPDWGAF